MLDHLLSWRVQLLPLVITMAAGLVLSSFGPMKTVSSTVLQEPENTAPKILITGVPLLVPIKLKVKNLEKQTWINDLEIEVTNNSDKPIYFFHVSVTLPEIKTPSGKKLGFWIPFGRTKLLDFETPVEPSDIPLKPGETVTLKIPESNARGWETLKAKEGTPEPTKVIVEFLGLNFGDGTGYGDASRTPVNIHKKINLNKSNQDTLARATPSGV